MDKSVFINGEMALNQFFRNYQKACFPMGSQWPVNAIAFTQLPTNQVTRFGQVVGEAVAEFDSQIPCFYYDFGDLEHYTHTLLTWQEQMEAQLHYDFKAFRLVNYILQRKANRCEQDSALEADAEFKEMDKLGIPELQSRYLFYFLKSLGTNTIKGTMPLVMILDHVERLEYVYQEIPYAVSHCQWLYGEQGLIANCPNVVWVLLGSNEIKKENLCDSVAAGLKSVPMEIQDSIPPVVLPDIADSSVVPAMEPLLYCQYLEQKAAAIETYHDLEVFVKSHQFLLPFYLESFQLEIFERCYHILKDVLDHYKNTEANAIVMHFYAKFLYINGMFEDALKNSKIAWNTLCRTDSAEALVLDCQELMAHCHGMLGNMDECLRLEEQIYDTCLRQYGFAHKATAAAIRNLALVHTQMGHADKAAELQQQLEDCEKELQKKEIS